MQLSHCSHSLLLALISSTLPLIPSHPSAVSGTRLLRNANHTASWPGSSIARRLALLVPALAEVVSARVHHNRTSEHALRPDQLDVLVGDGALGVALAVGLEVAQVANVALRVRGGAVLFAVGVEVRTGAGAAVGVVAEGVDVHATLGVGIVAGDVEGDLGLRALGGLLEGHGALDVGVSAEDGNCFNHCGGVCVV